MFSELTLFFFFGINTKISLQRNISPFSIARQKISQIVSEHSSLLPNTCHDLSLSQCSLPVSPLGSIATRFLEEEELRSHHILERLDAHIEELRRESERTVRQFTALV